MSCVKCKLSYNNSVHKDRKRYGYHEFVAPDPVYRQATLEERVEELERRVAELGQAKFQEH